LKIAAGFERDVEIDGGDRALRKWNSAEQQPAGRKHQRADWST
jgi:hypothetical protein